MNDGASGRNSAGAAGDARSVRLGDLQLRIMQTLWKESPLSVAEVQRRLPGEPLAYTTVATMLRKMESRQLVTHENQGRKFLYRPAISSEDASRGLAEQLVDRLFEGDLSAVVCHLLETREVDAAELDELERTIRAHRRRRKKS